MGKNRWIRFVCICKIGYLLYQIINDCMQVFIYSFKIYKKLNN